MHFPAHHVEACPPEDLVSRVRTAVEEGAAFVGVAGGDGTIRGGAEPLVGTDVPLLPVPTGTRNHLGVIILGRRRMPCAKGVLASAG